MSSKALTNHHKVEPMRAPGLARQLLIPTRQTKAIAMSEWEALQAEMAEKESRDLQPQVDPRSGFCKANGIYYSKRDPVILPSEDEDLDVPTYIFSACHRGRIAFIDAPTETTLSYQDLHQKVKALAAGLHALGIRKGDVVLVVSPYSIMIPCIYLGILSIGAILTTCNPLNTEGEMSRQIRDSNPCFIFTLPQYIHKISATQLPIALIQGTKQEGGQSCVSTLHQLLQSDVNSLPSVKIRQHDTATILYSSGTTGSSKGVISTHRNYIAMIEGYRSRVDMQSQSHFFLSSAHEMLSAVQKYRVTDLAVSPPILVALAKSEIANKYDLSSLQQIGSGGAPLGKDVIEKFGARFPGIQVTQIYGLTESSGAIAFTKANERIKNYGTAGSLSASVEAKVVDIVSRKPLSSNHVGELWLRGPTIMKGYFGNEEATASTIDLDGWLKTGDLCYIDEEGFLFVVDRLKELIKYKAFQVAPAELEELLFSHTEIWDAAVIPYPDENAGQIPMAYVVRKVDSKLSEQDVINFIAKQVSPYKKVRRVAFVNSIPKTPSGKILRKELIQQALSTSRL
eukprot:Gb_08075 [translate_table: standard]